MINKKEIAKILIFQKFFFDKNYLELINILNFIKKLLFFFLIENFFAIFI
jgi:hypothetical protein